MNYVMRRGPVRNAVPVLITAEIGQKTQKRIENIFIADLN
jgi:hypothetical protein